MNLHGIVSGAIAEVNPLVEAELQTSQGASVTTSGRRQPLYDPISFVALQVQPLSTSDIQKAGGLNLQGTTRKLFMTGEMNAIVRVGRKGGDLVTVRNGTWKGVWLVNMVVEQWPEWVSVIATLQNEEAQNG